MTAQDSTPPWLWVAIPLAFAIFFPLLWCFVLWLLSHASGWQTLARHYGTKEPLGGHISSGQYGMLGWVGYNGVLTVAVSDQGLFLDVLFLFRPGHQRLLIPWADLHNVTATQSFFRKQVKMSVGTPALATLRIPASALGGSPLAIG